MDMFPVRYTRLNCQGFAEAVSENVTVTELEDWTGKVPHAGFGGASKSLLYLAQGRENDLCA